MSWIIIRRRFRFWGVRRILWSQCWLWRRRMSRRVCRMSWWGFRKKCNILKNIVGSDISISKRQKIVEFNSRLHLWKVRKQLFSSSCWDFREGLLSWKCRWVLRDSDLIIRLELWFKFDFWICIRLLNINYSIEIKTGSWEVSTA